MESERPVGDLGQRRSRAAASAAGSKPLYLREDVLVAKIGVEAARPIGDLVSDAGDLAAYLRANRLIVVCDRSGIVVTSQPTTCLSPALKQRPPPDPS
jgi:hypothetical protein